jgi:hypothetical protein
MIRRAFHKINRNCKPKARKSLNYLTEENELIAREIKCTHTMVFKYLPRLVATSQISIKESSDHLRGEYVSY